MPDPTFTPEPETPNFLDQLQSRFRLFLLSKRELLLVTGIIVLGASVILSSRIVRIPTRLPIQADIPSPTPSMMSTPTISFLSPTPAFGRPTISRQGFLELIPITETLTLTPTPSGVTTPTLISTLSPTPSLVPTFTPIPTSTPSPTPTSEPTIFLPPLPR